MKVTDKDVTYVAELANLELSDEEGARLVRDLNSILDYVEHLSELDTSGIEPMAQVSRRYSADQSKEGADRFADASRDDVLHGLRESLPRDVALENAPETDGTFFVLPKVIER